MPQLEITQGTTEWLLARKHRITASVAASCLGLNPYASAAQAWRLITCREQVPPNEYMLKGIDQEENIRCRYASQAGLRREQILPGGFWTHDTRPWLAASPDGLIELNGVLELKWCKTQRKEVPIYHRIQCIVQMACTDRQWVDYFAWTCKTEEAPFWERIPRPHESMMSSMLNELERWYLAHVLADVCPPIKRRESIAEKRARQESLLWGFSKEMEDCYVDSFPQGW